jgi:hypothetical protein
MEPGFTGPCIFPHARRYGLPCRGHQADRWRSQLQTASPARQCGLKRPLIIFLETISTAAKEFQFLMKRS